MLEVRRLRLSLALVAVLGALVAQPLHAEEEASTLQGMLWGQTSAEYRAICRLVYNTATRSIEDRVRLGACPRDGQGRVYERFAIPGGEVRRPLAVIMDLDETVVDNSGFEAYLLKSGQTFNDKIWTEWVTYQSGVATRAVPGSVEFIRAAEALGVTVLYVSNRAEASATAVLKMMQSLGVGTKDLAERILLLRSKDEERKAALALLRTLALSPESEEGRAMLEGQSKKHRRRVELMLAYSIIGYFGDDYNDFPIHIPGATTGQALLDLRKNSVDRNLGHWGTDYFVLPNPVYGSWQSSLPRASRRTDVLDDRGFADWLKTRGPR